MSAESMLYYGAGLSFVVVLAGLVWGFVLLKITGEAE